MFSEEIKKDIKKDINEQRPTCKGNKEDTEIRGILQNPTYCNSLASKEICIPLIANK